MDPLPLSTFDATTSTRLGKEPLPLARKRLLRYKRRAHRFLKELSTENRGIRRQRGGERQINAQESASFLHATYTEASENSDPSHMTKTVAGSAEPRLNRRGPTMSIEDAQNKKQPAALSDSELSEVAGGLNWVAVKSTGKYYRWNHGDNHGDEKFLCPNCGRPVHWGSGWRYYCDPCDASWFAEGRLVPNIKSGLWTEISEWEYNHLESQDD